MVRGAPDFWLRGTRIDLIDLINTIKTIESIEKILSVREAYIKNIPALMNAGFETGDLTGWWTPTVEYYLVGKTYKFSGQYALQCKPARWTYYLEQVLEIPVQVKYLSHLTFYAYAADVEFYDSLVRCRCIYTDATYTDHDFTIPNDGAWHDCNMLPYLDETKDLRTIRIFILEVAGEPRETWLDDFILISYLPRVIVRRRGMGSRVEALYGTIGAETGLTLFKLVGKTCELRSLEFATDYRSMRLYIYAYDEEGYVTDSIGIAHYTGTTGVVVTPENLNTYKSDVFEELFYDTVNKIYKFRLRKSLSFENGLWVYYFNPDTVSHKAGGQVVVSILGD